MKKILICLLILLLPIKISATSFVSKSTTNYKSGCEVSTAPVEKDSYYDEAGNLVILYDNNVEVTYLNDELIIKDYGHNYSDVTSSQVQSRSAWVAIGVATYSVLGVCQAIVYVSGHDVCRIVLSYLGSRPYKVKYELTGRFIPGRIPGCEPMHSLACNSGYWEYRVKKM